MTYIRKLILLGPLAIALFFGIAFISVRFTPPRKLNQITIGSIGEAKILNPILATTVPDFEVIDVVFHGLVRYDENINLVPDLARAWEISQTSTLFFQSDADAQRAESALRRLQSRWPEWALTNITRDNRRLELGLARAGASYQESLLTCLGDVTALPVSFVRIDLADKAAINGQTATVTNVMPVLEAAWRNQPDAIISRFTNTASQFDLVVTGDTSNLVATLNGLLGGGQTNQPERLIGRAAVVETFPVLNEPEIRFALRPGVRWHDGKPFTARDIEFTLRCILDESVVSPRRSDFELIKQFDVIDEHNVRVIYRQPYAPSLGSWGIGILPRHVLEGRDTAWWAKHFNRSPVGTGPYRFLEWKSNQHIRLVKNDDYWEGKPHIDSIAIRTIPDPVAIRLLFETGELDSWGIDQHANSKFKQDQRFDTFSRISQSYNYVGWNLKRPMFQDPIVRRALAHAVNVPQIIQFILYGQGVQSTGPFPPSLWFSNPNIEPIKYDPARARALLAQAGWKPGPSGALEKDGRKFEFTLITNQANENRKDIATLVQSDLGKIGIGVKIELYEWAVFIHQYIDKQEFDACVLGWSLGFDYDQYQIWHSSQAKPNHLNFVSYKNPEADRLIELARCEFDEAKAKQYVWKLHELIYNDQPYLFLDVPKSTVALHRGEFAVRRPDGRGGWTDEPIRSTKLGVGIYRDWWRRPALVP